MTNRQTQIEDGFRDWIRKYSGLDRVIFDNQDGPRPERPYILIGDVTGWRKAQMTDSIESVPGDASGEQIRIRGRRTKVFQVDCFGVVNGDLNPQHVLEALRDTIDDPMAVEEQFRQGWAIENQGDPRDMTELRDTKFEPRAMMEFTLAAEFNRDTRPGYVEKVDITGTIGSQTREIQGPT